jgi:two-component system invasion response regulator UvrY
VSTYRARILEKTGTKNDVELALYAERQLRADVPRPT